MEALLAAWGEEPSQAVCLREAPGLSSCRSPTSPSGTLSDSWKILIYMEKPSCSHQLFTSKLLPGETREPERCTEEEKTLRASGLVPQEAADTLWKQILSLPGALTLPSLPALWLPVSGTAGLSSISRVLLLLILWQLRRGYK